MNDKKAELINALVKVATDLDKFGLHSLASQVDAALEEETSHIDKILGIYSRLHILANDDSNVKRALTAALRSSDRPDTPGCPFGLPIPLACSYVGDAISEMVPRKVEHEHNRRLYNRCRTHSACPFALQVLKNDKAVHCSFGTMNAGLPHWTEFSASPYYPKLWQAFNIPDPLAHDSNYYTYNDYSYFSLY